MDVAGFDCLAERFRHSSLDRDEAAARPSPRPPDLCARVRAGGGAQLHAYQGGAVARERVARQTEPAVASSCPVRVRVVRVRTTLPEAHMRMPKKNGSFGCRSRHTACRRALCPCTACRSAAEAPTRRACARSRARGGCAGERTSSRGASYPARTRRTPLRPPPTRPRRRRQLLEGVRAGVGLPLLRPVRQEKCELLFLPGREIHGPRAPAAAPGHHRRLDQPGPVVTDSPLGTTDD